MADQLRKHQQAPWLPSLKQLEANVNKIIEMKVTVVLKKLLEQDTRIQQVEDQGKMLKDSIQQVVDQVKDQGKMLKSKIQQIEGQIEDQQKMSKDEILEIKRTLNNLGDFQQQFDDGFADLIRTVSGHEEYIQQMLKLNHSIFSVQTILGVEPNPEYHKAPMKDIELSSLMRPESGIDDVKENGDGRHTKRMQNDGENLQSEHQQNMSSVHDNSIDAPNAERNIQLNIADPSTSTDDIEITSFQEPQQKITGDTEMGDAKVENSQEVKCESQEVMFESNHFPKIQTDQTSQTQVNRDNGSIEEAIPQNSRSESQQCLPAEKELVNSHFLHCSSMLEAAEIPSQLGEDKNIVVEGVDDFGSVGGTNTSSNAERNIQLNIADPSMSTDDIEITSFQEPQQKITGDTEMGDAKVENSQEVKCESQEVMFESNHFPKIQTDQTSQTQVNRDNGSIEEAIPQNSRSESQQCLPAEKELVNSHFLHCSSMLEAAEIPSQLGEDKNIVVEGVDDFGSVGGTNTSSRSSDASVLSVDDMMNNQNGIQEPSAARELLLQTLQVHQAPEGVNMTDVVPCGPNTSHNQTVDHTLSDDLHIRDECLSTSNESLSNMTPDHSGVQIAGQPRTMKCTLPKHIGTHQPNNFRDHLPECDHTEPQTTSVKAVDKPEVLTESESQHAFHPGHQAQSDVDPVQRSDIRSPSNPGDCQWKRIPMTNIHKRVLQSCYIVMIEDLEVEQVCPYLIQDGVLSDHDENKIQSFRDNISQREALLDILQTKEDLAFSCFVNALHECAQSYLANMLLNKECHPTDSIETESMTHEHRERLRRNLVSLLQDMPTTLLKIFMYAKGVFTMHDKDKIQNESTKMAKNKKILDILKRKGDKAYGIFEDGLRWSQQLHLYQRLQTAQEPKCGTATVEVRSRSGQNTSEFTEGIVKDVSKCEQVHEIYGSHYLKAAESTEGSIKTEIVFEVLEDVDLFWFVMKSPKSKAIAQAFHEKFLDVLPNKDDLEVIVTTSMTFEEYMSLRRHFLQGVTLITKTDFDLQHGSDRNQRLRKPFSKRNWEECAKYTVKDPFHSLILDRRIRAHFVDVFYRYDLRAYQECRNKIDSLQKKIETYQELKQKSVACDTRSASVQTDTEDTDLLERTKKLSELETKCTSLEIQQAYFKTKYEDEINEERGQHIETKLNLSAQLEYNNELEKEIQKLKTEKEDELKKHQAEKEQLKEYYGAKEGDQIRNLKNDKKTLEIKCGTLELELKHAKSKLRDLEEVIGNHVEMETNYQTQLEKYKRMEADFSKVKATLAEMKSLHEREIKTHEEEIAKLKEALVKEKEENKKHQGVVQKYMYEANLIDAVQNLQSNPKIKRENLKTVLPREHSSVGPRDLVCHMVPGVQTSQDIMTAPLSKVREKTMRLAVVNKVEEGATVILPEENSQATKGESNFDILFETSSASDDETGKSDEASVGLVSPTVHTGKDVGGNVQSRSSFYRQDSTNPTRGRGLDTVLVIDTSGSMKGQAFRVMKEAIKRFIQDVRKSHEMYEDILENIAISQIGLISEVVQHLTSDYDRLEAIIDNLPEPCGLSPMVDGLVAAHKELKVLGGQLVVAGRKVPSRIILFSDGITSDHIEHPPANQQDVAVSSQPAKMRVMTGVQLFMQGEQKLSISCVACGNRCDKTFLQSIANLGDGSLIMFEDDVGLKRLSGFYRRTVLVSRFAAPFKDSSDMQRMVGQDKEKFRAWITGVMPSEYGTENLDEFEVEEMFKILRTFGQARHENKNGEDDHISLEDRIFLHDIPVGTRVRRGPDWNDSDDTDFNCPGTVVEHASKKRVVVVWDETGVKRRYRFGQDEKYEVFPTDEPRTLKSGELIKEGVKVVRGKDWEWGNQDGGPGNVGVVYNVRDDALVNVRWPSGQCADYRFGFNGKFDVEIIGDQRTPTGQSMEDEEDMETGDTKVCWQYKDLMTDQWRMYPEHTNKLIERAHKKNSSGTIVVELNDLSRKIDLKNFTDTVTLTSESFPCRRQELKTADYETEVAKEMSYGT